MEMLKSKKAVLARLLPFPVTTVINPVNITRDDLIALHNALVVSLNT
jgi:hypothetical protein